MIITKNLCLDELKAKRRQNLPLKDFDQASQTNTPERITELHDTAASINQLMEKLPPQQKLVMHLRDIEQYEISEIAAITGINENAVRVNLSRARKQIREQLIKHNNNAYPIY